MLATPGKSGNGSGLRGWVEIRQHRSQQLLIIAGLRYTEAAPPKAGPSRGAGMQLDVNEIQKFLPHRYPFLLIDRVVEMERLKRIVAIKNVTINEGFFEGHFPGKPVMPGVLILESMAQAGGLLLLQEIPDRDQKLLYLASMNDVKFRRPVVPGDQLRVEVNILAWKGDLCKIQAQAFVGENLATEATLLCVMVDRDRANTNAAK
jgi:3-hydroxyacyl-[acyl-carrier-protein] dehydratase